MRIIFYLLMLSVVYCSEEQIFETKTAHVGANIKLTCPRRSTGTLFWIKLVSGNFPKIFGRSFSSQRVDQRIRTATEDGIFDLYISKVQDSDTGVYFCVKTLSRDLIFLRGTFLKVEGPEPAFTTALPSDPVHLAHTVTLQCSILRDFQNKSCPTDKRMFCLSAKSHQSHLDLNYSCVNGEDEYEKNPEELSAKTCFYSYFRNFSSFDFQAYYCSVATCVESSSGDKTKGDTAAVDRSNSKRNNIFFYLFIATLAISVIVIAFLVYSIKKLKTNSHVYSNAALETNGISGGDQENPQTDEDTLVYSTATFKKVSKSVERHKKPTEEDSIYAAVKAPVLD
ncbi:uncharacterized protein LOC120443067 [Oreochromis aureus]|uniref:Immunoglobulin domain-containing protein n=1 Tax=Oreochromis aureus TaxID=47969 RepID=A0AAZ1XDU4_OREAU|nr:uncharacterized protein LOC120443067 [Oreochromis aureus]